ncbi:acyl carrier protein [Syntrophomonas wolfei]|jgi:acyl carrier protein|uniref:acyl carrier protein n=1 Tax=Syntrophomonas wolfei TaxID=863 RepID=UPI000774DF72|nr:acyl carrier protein [Syntrophomonas wolfei]
MEERVKRIMAEILGIKQESINSKTTPDTVKEWDSLKHMQLILALEEEFSVEIPDEFIDKMLNVDMIFSVLRNLVE